MSACAVLLDRFELPERSLVAAFLVQHAALPQPVADKLSRRATAIVWENAPGPAAGAVAGALSAAGKPARVVPQRLVPQETTPRRVHTLQLDGEQLGFQLKYSGPPEWVAPSDVLVISAGAFKTQTRKTEQTETYLMHGEVIRDERVQIDIARSVIADLFAVPAADRTAMLHVRLNSQEVNYAQTLGGTIHESWREKFSVLIAKLGLRAERALVSPQTEALLAAGMMPESCALDPYFNSDEEFAAYTRWLLCR
jgi:hypothetical protein